MQQIDFSQLKEYDSLSRREQQLLSEIQQENERTNKIHSLIENHLLKRQEIKSAIVQKNSQILDNESQLTVLQEQISRLILQGVTEDKIKEYQEKIANLEDQSFSFLEVIETLESELKETMEFEAGARKTLQEIETEVEQIVQIKNQELKALRSHQQDLLSQLPKYISNLLLKLIKKKLTHGPFTKIATGSCMVCRFKISKLDEAEIDVHKNLKQCPQCERIFLPYGV